MTAILDDSQAGFWYPGGHFLMDLKWGEGVLPPAKDKGGALDCCKIVSAVRPPYDGGLLTHEYLGSQPAIHFPNIVTKLFILHSIGVKKKG